VLILHEDTAYRRHRGEMLPWIGGIVFIAGCTGMRLRITGYTFPFSIELENNFMGKED